AVCLVPGAFPLPAGAVVGTVQESEVLQDDGVSGVADPGEVRQQPSAGHRSRQPLLILTDSWAETLDDPVQDNHFALGPDHGAIRGPVSQVLGNGWVSPGRRTATVVNRLVLRRAVSERAELVRLSSTPVSSSWMSRISLRRARVSAV